MAGNIIFFILLIILIVLCSELFVLAIVGLIDMGKSTNTDTRKYSGGYDQDIHISNTKLTPNLVPELTPNLVPELMPISIEKHIELENKSLFIDGNNVIHSILYDKSWPISSFNQALTLLADSLKREKRPVHIIIKSTKKSKIDVIKKIAMLHPNITFHIAQSISNKQEIRKIDKARDDLLTIWLSKNGYVISNDLYRDFSTMNKVPPFNHITIHSTHVQEKILKPSEIHAEIEYFDRPSTANHLRFNILDAKTDNNLSIKKDELGYLIYHFYI